MKRLLILFFVFITYNSFSQDINGIVRDRSNLKEIAYASIFYKHNNIGTYSDSTGNFKIQKIKGDTLIVSSMGFEKDFISEVDIRGAIQVNLLPISINLNEVLVKGSESSKSKKGKKIHLGNFSKRYAHISGMKGRTVAYLIKPNALVVGKIASIEYGVKAEADAIVRAHLYTVDGITGKPSDDLIKTPEFISLKRGSKKLEIDLNHLNVELPSGGVFVGLEWIGEIKNNKLINISPIYTCSKSTEPVTVYIKFMDKNWELVPKRKVNIPYGQKAKNNLEQFFFEEPNFKIMLIQ
ncbi:carboxypeptidase-like regulatory domain-containing protein [Pedobacter boryungensis]|uniref:Carboxypeptidase-like regulatory domain-containing protein n=1 Tax=Pedobacter boryungensis TaxID=869962 RepID=A0ABX2DEE9_9SPHI|nr:carboxypeptidase-like regulatory domain-containing protein [Pedobacter boryungensis]NQX31671.1 carboxypeptidase-like regulatory domain-containing protein [Pedobacter boryungensis]